VARDPFESAVVARNIAKSFGRPAQLHVLDDYTTADFIKKARHNWWRRFFPRYTIKSFMSVRATTGSIERMLARRFTIPDLSLLPKFHNYKAIAGTPATLNLKEKYRSFVFNIIFIGKLTYESTLYRAIDAARFVLRNPRVGLIVLGDGPARAEFEHRAKILGVERQVVFETRVTDVVSYLKSGNLLLATDTDSDADETILMGAAAGIPIIMSRTARREDIFEHGVSAFLCEETDTQAFADRINDLLNNVGLRKVFTSNANAMVARRFHQNIDDYRESYRTSIEHALFVESDEEIADSASERGRG
jgi:glycosyltransferase involved in cell wall biosynthesis